MVITNSFWNWMIQYLTKEHVHKFCFSCVFLHYHAPARTSKFLRRHNVQWRRHCTTSFVIATKTSDVICVWRPETSSEVQVEGASSTKAFLSLPWPDRQGLVIVYDVKCWLVVLKCVSHKYVRLDCSNQAAPLVASAWKQSFPKLRREGSSPTAPHSFSDAHAVIPNYTVIFQVLAALFKCELLL